MAIPNTSEKPLFEATGAAIAEVSAAPSAPPKASDITAYIKARFDILMAGEEVDLDDLSQVKEFLLTDIHNRPIYSAINSHFINTFATSEDTVLIESEKAGEIVRAEESGMGALLTSAALVKGWDLGPGVSYMSDGYDKISMMKGENLLKLMSTLQGQFHRAPPAEHEGILSRFREEAKHYVAYAKSHLEEVERCGSIGCLRQTFPARQESMKHTIQTESSLSSGRVFLIAGFNHLQTNRTLCKSFPEFSAEDFLAFAKSRNVVILRARESTDKEAIIHVKIAGLFYDIMKSELLSQGVTTTPK